MALATIEKDIPGSSVGMGVTDQFNDYAVRRHLVKGVATHAAAQAALQADLGIGWTYHHVIDNLPCQKVETQYAGLNMFTVDQVFYRKRWNLNRSASAVRQNFRWGLDATPVYIKSSASRTNGLPYDAAPTPPDFYLLPLDSTDNQAAYLEPVAYMYERPTFDIVDMRSYDAYPISAAQAAAFGKVNNAALTINTLGLTFAANECRLIGANFDMVSDGTGSTGRWTGAFYFKGISGGWYHQRAYWDPGSSSWKVSNDLLYESANLSIF